MLSSLLRSAALAFAFGCLTAAGAQPPPQEVSEDETLRRLTLDDATTARLRETGIVVQSEGSDNLYACYYDGEMDGTALYITADAMLYLWYEAHREALMAVERDWLRPQTMQLVSGLLSATQRLRQVADDPDLRSNALMLSVVCSLLDPQWQPPEELAAETSAEVARVREHILVQTYPGEDYTQYEVRGHYAKDEGLGDYFRGAKYLARRYLVISEEAPQGPDSDLRRALLLTLAMRSEPGLADLYGQLAQARRFLSGPVDTIGLDEVASAAETVWGNGWGREALGDLSAIRRELTAGKYTKTRITTRYAGKEILRLPPWNVAVLGEHYPPDSELFHHTAEPAVMDRHLPSGLDVATALGSDLAARELSTQAPEFPDVVPNARALSEKMDLQGVYGSWMRTLRKLFDRPEGLPEFALTEPYDRKQLDCCLTRWAQLRHHYILYGAQAYTCCGAGSGAGIVEPLPGFITAYAAMCGERAGRLEQWQVQGRPVQVLRRLEGKAATFARCAEDQLAGRDTYWASEDIHLFASFIRSVYFDTPLVVADMATSSWTDEVLHAGSGLWHRGLVTYMDKGKPTIAPGWVGSYYEFAEPGLGRVKDSEWKTRMDSEYLRPQPPSWLAGLYETPDGAGATEREELGKLERLPAEYLAAELKAGEEFIAREAETEWAPAAVLLMGTRLEEAGRRDEVIAMLGRARPMYGCDARDAALRGLDQCRWRLERQADDERDQRGFEGRLAATAPQPGLSAAEELQRQDRSAEVLLNRVEGLDREWEPWRAAALQVLAECPQSGYVPYAALMAASGEPRFSETPPDEEVVKRERADLLEVAARYPGSAIGLAARTMAAHVTLGLGDIETAFAEAQQLLTLKPSVPDPYPLSAKRLSSTRLETVWPHELGELADSAARVMLPPSLSHRRPAEGEGGPRAGAGGDRGPHGDGGRCDGHRLPCRRARSPARTAAAAGTPPRCPRGPGGADAERRRDGGCRATRCRPVPAQQGGARGAVPGLVDAAHLAAPTDDAGLRDDLEGTLAARYPDSLECLAVLYMRAFCEGDPEPWNAYARRTADALAAPSTDPAAEAYREWVAEFYRDNGPRAIASPEQIAQYRQRYDPFIAEAKLADDDLRGCAYEDGLVELLAKRLPERALAIVLATGEPRDHGYLASAALERRPDDPQAHELRLRLGGLDDIAAVVAAGPDVPQFQAAVDLFPMQAPSQQERLAEDLYEYRALGRKHAGTPAEVLCWAAMTAAYVRNERPEQGLRFADELLATIGPERLLRERLQAQRDEAQQRIDLKRAGPMEPVWTVPLARTGRGRGVVVAAPDGARLYVTTSGDAGQPVVRAVHPQTGARLWETPLPGPVALTPTADRVL